MTGGKHPWAKNSQRSETEIFFDLLYVDMGEQLLNFLELDSIEIILEFIQPLCPKNVCNSQDSRNIF